MNSWKSKILGVNYEEHVRDTAIINIPEEFVMIQNEARIEDGIVHITNRRIVYEKKAVKRLRRDIRFSIV